MQPYQHIISLLNNHDVPFEELDHDPVYTTEDAAAVDGLTLEGGAKSLLLKTKQGFVLAVMSGHKKLDSKKFKKALGVKDLRFASPAEVQTVMGCIIGACYPFGSVAKVPTFVDESLLQQTTISFNPGLHDKSVKVASTDYVRVEQPTVAAFTI